MCNDFQPLTLKCVCGRLSALKSANNASIKLVALHGWLDNLGSVLPILSALPSISSLTFDWRGHGLSDWTNATHYVFSDYLQDLHDVLHQECDTPVWLLGHSLGALVATTYAAIYPEKIAGLILIEGLAPLSEPEKNIISRLRQHIDGECITNNVGRQSFDDLTQAIRWRAKLNQTSFSAIRPLVERGLKPQKRGWQWRFDPKLWGCSPWRFTPDQAQHLCEQVRCPVLSLVGDKGFAWLRDPLGELSWFSRIEQKTLPGGHHCHLQNVTLSATLIFDFLTVHDRT